MQILEQGKTPVYFDLLASLQDMLNQLEPIDNTSINDDVWQFSNVSTRNHSVTLNFNLFDYPHLQFRSNIKMVFNGQQISLSIKELAKLLWLEQATGKLSTSSTYYPPFEVISSLFAFLTEQEIESIEQHNLEDFYSFTLTNDIEERGVIKRLSYPSYGKRVGNASFSKIYRILCRYKAEGIIDVYQRKKLDKALNNTCIAIFDMTLSDYKEGGSLNFLGLDIGRHYIDHCATVLETYYQFATAYRLTIEDVVDIVKDRLPITHDNSIKQAACAALCCNPMEKGSVKALPNWSQSSLSEVGDIALDIFREKFNKIADISNAFNVDTVDNIISITGLPERYDVQEFVRSMLIARFIGDFGKKPQNIFNEYVAALNSNEKLFSMSYEEFIKLTLIAVNQESKILPVDKDAIRNYLNEIINKAPHTLDKLGYQDKLNSIARHVESAGTTLFVSLSGWRRSEFGFPLSSIDVSVNTDVLDNLYTPWRFHVIWHVPKTSGKTPLDREITSYTYQIAFMLDKLNCSNSDKPALYKQFGRVKNIFESAGIVANRVDVLWEDFILNYSLFRDIDILNNLKSKSNLSKNDKTQLKQLELDYYLNNAETKMLMQIRDQLRDALPKYRLTTPSDNDTFGKRLTRYCDGSLENKWEVIFDEYLAAEFKEKLKSGDYTLDGATTKFLRNQVLQNDVWPSPHAFRHIWAEAVLMRYRGDVGKFIRANFKHLDERFFMNYLRDKETKAVYQVATRTIINSVVRKQIHALTDNSREYAGGFDRFLSRAVRFTNVIDSEGFEKLATNISEQRVIDIKSNPWATCLLRISTEKTANCSKGGVPQRRNAEPRLCLGCVNADIAYGNFNGIVIYIQDDIAVCRNHKLPCFMKVPHIKTVKIALKKVEELKLNSGSQKYDKFISHLYETLEMAPNCPEVAHIG